MWPTFNLFTFNHTYYNMKFDFHIRIREKKKLFNPAETGVNTDTQENISEHV